MQGGPQEKRGTFERADGGTLFLDEVGDMSLKTQAKVLRALDEQRFLPVGAAHPVHVDVRVIAATNKDLEEEIARGNFREDLFYRLNVIPFYVPPLRDRKEDIPLLVKEFFEEFGPRYGRTHVEITEDALTTLRQYHWPGNVRELERVIEHAVALAGSDRLEVDDLPPRLLTGYEHIILPSIRRQDTMREWAARYARLVLERCQNNKRRACRELGISYHTLQGHLRYGTRARALSSGPQ